MGFWHCPRRLHTTDIASLYAYLVARLLAGLLLKQVQLLLVQGLVTWNLQVC
jgi:hypothetical protein